MSTMQSMHMHVSEHLQVHLLFVVEEERRTGGRTWSCLESWIKMLDLRSWILLSHMASNSCVLLLPTHGNSQGEKQSHSNTWRSHGDIYICKFLRNSAWYITYKVKLMANCRHGFLKFCPIVHSEMFFTGCTVQ